VPAHDLLRSDAPFIADTSAWWRVIALPDDLVALVQDAVREDRLWITPIVRMEILYSARTSSEYVALEASCMRCESCVMIAPWPTRRCARYPSSPSATTAITAFR
jgi:predicted nucleic acid-binding protein